MTPHEYQQTAWMFLEEQNFDISKIYSVEVHADDKILVHQHLTTENGVFIHALTLQNDPSICLYDAKGDLVPQHNVWNKYRNIVNEAVQWTTILS